MTTELGFISIRNEDGTQWRDENGFGDWRFRRPCTIELFRELESRVEESKKNDCPDNGFFGLWNLTWHPCTPEEADAQNAAAAAKAEAREEAEYDRMPAAFERANALHDDAAYRED